MLQHASELLEKFIQVEKAKLSGVKMPHMPTLGSAYEEITKNLMIQDFTIPKNLDLRAVSGFVKIGDEMLPEQIDCMLVHGDGLRYGMTDNYIYDIEKVLCIFEVKKTLKKTEYADAMQHLATIRRKYAAHFETRLARGEYPDVSAAARRFAQITGKIAPDHYLGMHSIPKEEGVLFYTLIQESIAPASIIHGYDGFKTEHGFRSAFASILEESWNTDKRLGIPSIPSLVTCGQFCNIKCNGFPFMTVQDGNWVPVVSTCHNSAIVILDIIWSKISKYFSVEMPWDEGLYMNNTRSLLMASVVSSEDKTGWFYKTLEPKTPLLERDDDAKWSPYEIGAAEVTAINLMVAKGGYLELDEELDEYLQATHGRSVESVIEALMLSLEFMMDGDYLRPISNTFYMISTAEEKGYIASDKPRFDLWCKDRDINPSYLVIYFI